MYESLTTVGERGQITIPKIIREKKGIKSKDKVIVKVENGTIVLEKALGRKEKEDLMREYYTKYSKENKELSEEMISASAEVDF